MNGISGWRLVFRMFVAMVSTGFVGASRAGGDGEENGWLLAVEPREFVFPRDHHVHEGFRTEWWYFTGNLEDVRTGEAIGFQFTLFRQGVREPGAAAAPSAWTPDAFGFGHAALSFSKRGDFRYDQIMERGVFGGVEFPAYHGGAEGEALLARVGGWQVSRVGRHDFRLRADFDGNSMELELRALVDPMLNGEDGLSQKGPGRGNASYYYTMPRFETTGVVTRDGERHEVRGGAWLDREWASNQLAPGQVGWDWFALQFADGRDLMIYQIRLADGGVEPHSHGTLRLADGTVVPVKREDFELTPLAHWRSPETGGEYPVRWRLEIPSQGMDLEIEAVQRAQELALQPVSYYEGAVRVRESGGKELGRGYMELTGYAAPLEALQSVEQ